MKKNRMKHVLALLLGAALLWGSALPAAAAWSQEAFDAAKGNLIKNPGFENSAANWTTEGDVNADKDAAYTGASGMLFKGPYTPKISQEVTLKGNTEYVLNLVAKSSRKLASTLNFSFVVGNNRQRLGVQQLKTGWHRYSFTLNFPSDTTGTLVLAAGGSTDVSLDDVCLAPSSTITPSIPMDTSRNVVLNSGFESGLTGWKALVKENEETDSSDFQTGISLSGDAHTGSHSLHISRSLGFPKAVAQLSPDMPAGEYEVTAYVKAQGSVDFSFRNTDILHTYEITSMYYSAIVSDTSWCKVSFTMHLNPDSPAYFLSVSSTTSHDILIDDVSIVPTGYTLPHSGQEPEPQPDNLLQNPGFETGLNGWTQQGAPNSFSTDGQAYTGTHSVYFGYFASAPMESYIEQTVAAGAGSYTFSAMVKPDATLQGVGCVLMLEALDNSGRVLASISSPAVYDAAKGWQKTQAALTAPAGTTTLRAKIGGIYCTGAFFVDDAVLVSKA